MHIIRVGFALLPAHYCYANILNTSATVRSNNSLIVDVQVTTDASVAQVFVSYETDGVDPLVSRLTPVSATGPTTVTIGRLRANRTYTYTVDAIDGYGGPAGTIVGTFTTGSLPATLLTNNYTLSGRMTSPLVIVVDNQPAFKGYVGLHLRSSDAPQIVWYYSNASSTASGSLKVDSEAAIDLEPKGISSSPIQGPVHPLLPLTPSIV